jgi:ABC-type sugar transport system permease subunit
MGYAAAMAVTLGVFMLIVALILFRVLGERVEY